MNKQQFISALEREWTTDGRWEGVTRPYTAGDVYRLRGSIDIEYSLARYGAARLWQLFQDEAYVAVLSATTEIYTLSLHDALPIFHGSPVVKRAVFNRGIGTRPSSGTPQTPGQSSARTESAPRAKTARRRGRPHLQIGRAHV